jgi:hypothetical protein
MEYEVKKIVEEIDMISLTPSEYDKINEFYCRIISKRFPQLAKNKQIYNVRRLIMTDDLSRAEVIIAVNGKEPKKLKTPDIESLEGDL